VKADLTELLATPALLSSPSVDRSGFAVNAGESRTPGDSRSTLTTAMRSWRSG